jgi:hypothetical protein
MRDLHNQYAREKGGKSGLGELFIAGFGVVDDEAEQAVLGGVGQRHGKDADAPVLENLKNLDKAALSVFDKYG